MDPPLVNESSFSGANPGSCSLSEFWPFGGGDMSASVGLRMSILGQNFGGFMENSANLDGSAEESTVTEQSRSRGGCGAGKKRRDANSEDESSKIVSRTSGNDLNNSIRKRMKTSRSSDENGGSKIETETSSGTGNKSAEQSTQLSQYPKQDFIHVRARRGQATGRHSLAERARREKISERMKILQDLVPACNNVIGKALVLDEIINYIQSLQRQVEFLSMKLEAVNSRMNPTNERLPSKDVFDTAGMIFGPPERREYAQGWQTEWLHRQLGGNFERAT